MFKFDEELIVAYTGKNSSSCSSLCVIRIVPEIDHVTWRHPTRRATSHSGIDNSIPITFPYLLLSVPVAEARNTDDVTLAHAQCNIYVNIKLPYNERRAVWRIGSMSIHESNLFVSISL